MFKDYLDIDTLQGFLSELGINNPLPETNGKTDFSLLEPGDIRLFNRLITKLKAEGKEKIDDFIPQEYFKTTNLISKKDNSMNKSTKIISFSDFEKFLKSVDLLHSHKHLSDSMTHFLEIFPDYGDLFTLSKLRRSLNAITA